MPVNTARGSTCARGSLRTPQLYGDSAVYLWVPKGVLIYITFQVGDILCAVRNFLLRSEDNYGRRGELREVLTGSPTMLAEHGAGHEGRGQGGVPEVCP